MNVQTKSTNLRTLDENNPPKMTRVHIGLLGHTCDMAGLFLFRSQQPCHGPDYVAQHGGGSS